MKNKYLSFCFFFVSPVLFACPPIEFGPKNPVNAMFSAEKAAYASIVSATLISYDCEPMDLVRPRDFFELQECSTAQKIRFEFDIFDDFGTSFPRFYEQDVAGKPEDFFYMEPFLYLMGRSVLITQYRVPNGEIAFNVSDMTGVPLDPFLFFLQDLMLLKTGGPDQYRQDLLEWCLDFASYPEFRDYLDADAVFVSNEEDPVFQLEIPGLQLGDDRAWFVDELVAMTLAEPTGCWLERALLADSSVKNDANYLVLKEKVGTRPIYVEVPLTSNVLVLEQEPTLD